MDGTLLVSLPSTALIAASCSLNPVVKVLLDHYRQERQMIWTYPSKTVEGRDAVDDVELRQLLANAAEHSLHAVGCNELGIEGHVRLVAAFPALALDIL